MYKEMNDDEIESHTDELSSEMNRTGQNVCYIRTNNFEYARKIKASLVEKLRCDLKKSLSFYVITKEDYLVYKSELHNYGYFAESRRLGRHVTPFDYAKTI